jgi:hypothetical protein
MDTNAVSVSYESKLGPVCKFMFLRLVSKSDWGGGGEVHDKNTATLGSASNFRGTEMWRKTMGKQHAPERQNICSYTKF